MSSNEASAVVAAAQKDTVSSTISNEEEEEEDYEEAEPVLAYSRMKNDFNEILAKDSVSCIKAGHKVKKLIGFINKYMKKIVNLICGPNKLD